MLTITNEAIKEFQVAAKGFARKTAPAYQTLFDRDESIKATEKFIYNSLLDLLKTLKEKPIGKVFHTPSDGLMVRLDNQGNHIRISLKYDIVVWIQTEHRTS